MSCPPAVSKQRGAPKPEPTQKVTRKPETTSVKVKVKTFLFCFFKKMTTHGAHLNFIWVSCRALILTLLHPCSAETAARWWLFQESSLPWLPVSHDPRPHQPLPIQRLAVSQRKNSKCPCALLIRSPPHLFFSPFLIFVALSNEKKGR